MLNMVLFSVARFDYWDCFATSNLPMWPMSILPWDLAELLSIHVFFFSAKLGARFPIPLNLKQCRVFKVSYIYRLTLSNHQEWTLMVFFAGFQGFQSVEDGMVSPGIIIPTGSAGLFFGSRDGSQWVNSYHNLGLYSGLF